MAVIENSVTAFFDNLCASAFSASLRFALVRALIDHRRERREKF
jgi:hypothetical protein